MLCLQGVWMGPLHAQRHAVVRQGVFPDAQRYHLLPQAWSTQVQCQVSGTMSFSCCGLTMPHDHKNEMHLTLDYLIHCLCYHGADGILEPTAVFCVVVPWPYNNVTLGTVGWVGLWGFLWWAPSAKRKDHHGVSSGWSSVWHCSNTCLSSTQYEQIPIILGVWPFWLTTFFFRSIRIWRAYG